MNTYRLVGDDEPIEAGDFWLAKGVALTDGNVGLWGDTVSSFRVGKTINYFKEHNVGYPDHKLLYRKVKAPRKLTGNAYYSKELPLP